MSCPTLGVIPAPLVRSRTSGNRPGPKQLSASSEFVEARLGFRLRGNDASGWVIARPHSQPSSRPKAWMILGVCGGWRHVLSASGGLR